MFYESGVLWKFRLPRKGGSGLWSAGAAGSLPCRPRPGGPGIGDPGALPLRQAAAPRLRASSPSPPPWLLTCLQPSSLGLPGLPDRPASARGPSVRFRVGVVAGGHVPVTFAAGKRRVAVKRGQRGEVWAWRRVLLFTRRLLGNVTKWMDALVRMKTLTLY